MQRYELTPAGLVARPATQEALAFGSEPHTEGYILDIANDIDLAALPGLPHGAAGVRLQFPAFADGRAYTQARHLRARLAFRGAIIAAGDVLPDQLFFMRRCGIDHIETDRTDIETFNRALTAFSHVYQPAADGQAPVWALRHGRRKRLAA